jgi:epoxyqueuosine reductase
MDTRQLADKIRQWGRELGFQQIGFTDIDLAQAEQHLHDWLDQGYHAGMDWMTHHGHKRSRPAELEPGTLSVISARMDYLPPDTEPWQRLEEGDKAYISRYALGRDYHKLVRKRLAQLAEYIRAEAAEAGLARALVDSAPVMEKPLAEKAGLGWQGKHTVLINRQAGSWFFLGEIYTDIPLPVDDPASEHCGSCSACMDICPTGAIVGPWELDAGKCISYLTIEHKGSIPEELRPLMGNRVFGCDDCQLICPWNRYADFTGEADFAPRHGLDDARLVDLFRWDEATFDERTRGSPIRRAGYEGWLRNLAVALGNAPWSAEVEAALNERAEHPSELVREHVHWALAQQHARRPADTTG